MTTVLPQVNKWSQEITNSTQQSVNKSLALVPHGQYYIKYNVLKEKYGKELVKVLCVTTCGKKVLLCNNNN